MDQVGTTPPDWRAGSSYRPVQGFGLGRSGDVPGLGAFLVVEEGDSAARLWTGWPFTVEGGLLGTAALVAGLLLIAAGTVASWQRPSGSVAGTADFAGVLVDHVAVSGSTRMVTAEPAWAAPTPRWCMRPARRRLILRGGRAAIAPGVSGSLGVHPIW